MSEQPTHASRSEILQILITEHNNLQVARSATIFEANGRTNLFLGAVSSGIVALAFIGQMSGMSSAFYIFALILLPSLMFMGFVTFIRVNQTGTEDMIAARGINRIRHYYAEIAPQAERYFILSKHDDMFGYLDNLAAPASVFQMFASTAGLVSVINSVLTAVFAGLLIYVAFNASLLICIVVGVVVFVVSVALYMWYQHRDWKENEQRMTVLFPSENKDLSVLGAPQKP
jgi:hypothetical protein